MEARRMILGAVLLVVFPLLFGATQVRSQDIALAVCNTTHFMCPGGSCEPNDYMCDYYNDCTDGSDENGCGSPPANLDIALLYSTHNEVAGSTLWILFGNPDDYAAKLTNMSAYNRSIPIRFAFYHQSTTNYYSALAVDHETRIVYVANNAMKRIEYGRHATLNSSYRILGSLNLTQYDPSTVNGMSFDWLTKTLYWTNGLAIYATRFVGSGNGVTRTVVSSGLFNVQDVVVDPIANYLFWCDFAIPSKLMRSDLAGNNRQVFAVTATPEKLDIDVSNQIMYYYGQAAGVGRLAYISSYNGTALRNATLNGRSAFTQYQDYIVIGDSSKPSFYILNRTTLTQISSYDTPTKDAFGPVVDTTMFASSKQPPGTGPCAVNNGGCDQFCVPSLVPTTRVCQCGEGFKLSANGLACIGVCSALQFQCPIDGRCIDSDWLCDYYQDCLDNADEASCGFPPVNLRISIIYSVREPTGHSSLWKLFGDPRDYVVKLNNVTAYNSSIPFTVMYYQTDQPLGYYDVIDVDFKNALMYFGDNANHKLHYGPFIYGANYTSGDFSYNISRNAIGASFDWLAKNLYWTDSVSISVVRADRGNFYSRLLRNNALMNITDIAVDPINRYLFWSDAAVPNTIVRSDLLAGNLVNIVVGCSPTKLQVNVTEQKVYFLDRVSGTFGSIAYDGSSLQTWSIGSNKCSAFAVYSNFVTFGDFNGQNVYFYDKTSMSLISTYDVHVGTIPGQYTFTDVVVFSASNQPAGTNACAVNNGGCSHVCLATSATTRLCECQAGFSLLPDGVTCVKACSDAEYQCPSDGRCIWKNWLCDYYQDCMDNTDEASCGLPPVNMNISIIYSTIDAQNHSALWKLFGNPDDYATKLNNMTAYNRSIPFRFLYVDFAQPAGLYDAITVDYANALMYIVDNANHGMHNGPFVYSPNFTAADRFHGQMNMNKMTGVALDWVAQNLYFTDGVSIRIVHPLASDLSVFNPGLLTNTSLFKVIAIDVDPVNRYLFWVDSAVSNTIVRADLLANNRVNITVGCSPTKLHVNVTEQKIYFLDPINGTFGYAAYDGSNLQTLIPGFGEFSAFAVYENYLFLGETNSLTIHIYNKETLEMISSYRNTEMETSGYSVNNMVVFSARNQPSGNSPCVVSNGGCNQICIATSATSRVCACQDGFALLSDSVTCSEICDATIQCPDGWCVPSEYVCDYFDNCGDGSDEDNCGTPPANLDIALIYSTHNQTVGSTLWILFGNPDDYATKLVNVSAYNRSIPIRFEFYHQPTPNYYSALAVDHDTRIVYVANNAMKRIEYGRMATLNNSEPKLETMNLTQYDPSTVNGMSFDWLTKTLYWTNGLAIYATRFNGSSNGVTRTVVSSGLTNVQDVVVDPIANYLFWSDVAKPSTLLRSDLAGNNRQELAVVVTPQKLDIDVSNQIVYYYGQSAGDGRLAWLSTYNGTAQRSATLNGRSSFVQYQDYIFVGDSSLPTFYILNRTRLTQISSYETPTHAAFGPVVDMTIFASSKQPPGTGVCAVNNGGCDQFCVPSSPTTRNCQCGSGFNMSANGRSCIGGPCLVNNGGCNQICLATSVTSRVCECQDGFSLLNDTVTCSKTCTEAEYKCPSDGKCIWKNWLCDYYQDCMDNTDEALCGLPPADMNISIIYSTIDSQNHSALFKLFGNPDDYAVKLNNMTAYNRSIPFRFLYFDFGQPAGLYDAIAVDYANALMYIVDNANRGIHSGPFVYSANFTAADIFHGQMNVNKMTGAALDWVAQNLYFTDGVSIRIVHPFASDLGVFNPGLLSNTSLFKVIALDVDPVNRYLFWVDAAVPNTIVRADLLANNRVNITVGCSPTKLQVNVAEQKIYFLDPINGQFGYAAYDGSNLQALIPGFNGFSSFAVYKNYLFLGEKNTLTIHIYNKETLEKISSYRNPEMETGGYSVSNMVVFSARNQPPGNNPCATSNGGCNHICIATSATTKVCQCQDGYTLLSDAVTCANICSALQFQCPLDGRCIDKEWMCDYYQDCTDNADDASCGFPPVNMNISIIYSVREPTGHSSLWKLFGDPRDYIVKLNNVTAYNRSIPFTVMYYQTDQPLGYFDVIDVDFKNALLYFGDNANHRLHYGPFIYGANYTSGDFSYNVTKNLVGASFDWLAKNLYWTDSVSISVVRADRGNFYSRLLRTSSLMNITDIAVDPISRYLFWADAAVPNAIVRVDLLAGNSVSITVGCSPTKLQVNVTEQKVYFLDRVTGTFGSVAYVGSSLQTWSIGSNTFSAFAVYSNFVTFGDFNGQNVYFYDKTLMSLISTYGVHIGLGTTPGQYTFTDVVVFSASNQPAATNPCSVNNGGCGHVCLVSSATTRLCECQAGYSLLPDGVTCVKACNDAEYQCPSDGRCIWKNWLCDYYQDCMDNTDEAPCGLPPANMNISIIYSTIDAQNHSVLWKLFGNPDDYATKFNNMTAYNRSIPFRFLYFDFLQPAGLYDALAVDYANALMYIVDNANHGIHSGPFVYSGNFTAADRFHELINMHKMTDAALDWVAQNLYFTDGVSIQIVHPLASDLSVFRPGLLSNTSLFRVIAIDVDPINRFLFWVDSAVPNTIVRADLLASNRVNITVGCSPTKLQVNVTEQKIYFLDPISGKFGYVAYDGSNFQALTSGFNGFSAFAVYENYLFLGEKNATTVHIYNKQTLQMISSYTITGSNTPGYSVTDMIVFSVRNQPPGNNPCTVNNGGCDQICIATNDSLATCMCGTGFAPTGGMQCSAVSAGHQAVSSHNMLIWSVVSSLIYIIGKCSGYRVANVVQYSMNSNSDLNLLQTAGKNRRGILTTATFLKLE